MGNLINNDMKAPIDLSKFESLISDLSHVIILFPESAGSYAEAGLFSAYSHIRKKTLMVIDEKYQYSDSFISLGPANSFNAHSIFRPNIFIDYDSKAFDGVFDRIKRIGISKKKKKLLLSSFSELEPFEVLGLIQKVVSLLRLATSDDITYIFRAIFGNHLSTRKLNELISISVGAKFLLQKGEYGQYHSSNNLPTLLETREGMKNIENTLRFEISEHIANTDDTFLNPLES